MYIKTIDGDEYFSSDHDIREIEIFIEVENAEYNDLEDLIFGMELTYSESEYILDVKYIAASSTGYTLPPSIHKISDLNKMLLF